MVGPVISPENLIYTVASMAAAAGCCMSAIVPTSQASHCVLHMRCQVSGPDVPNDSPDFVPALSALVISTIIAFLQ